VKADGDVLTEEGTDSGVFRNLNSVPTLYFVELHFSFPRKIRRNKKGGGGRRKREGKGKEAKLHRGFPSLVLVLKNSFGSSASFNNKKTGDLGGGGGVGWWGAEI